VARSGPGCLDERRRAALLLADAFVTDPGRLEREAREQVLARLSQREVVELLFDVIAWSQQKVLVALSLDAPVDPGALTSLDFDDDGHAVVGSEGPWQRRI
jgi:alkylhydroperoxidase family enzyme